MPFVAAVSVHPLAAHAAGEVVGRILEQLDEPVDVAILVVSGAHGRQFEQIAAVIRATLGPRGLVGACVAGLIAGDQTIVEQPAIALWAGTATTAASITLEARTGEDVVVTGLDLADAADLSSIVVLAGPSFPIDVAAATLRERYPTLTIVGGCVAGGLRRADNQLLRDDDVSTSGAVGIVLDRADVIVSRGFRPIGVPLVVTAADGAVIQQLAGRPILDRLDEVLLGLDDGAAAAVSRSLHLGQVVDEHLASFGPGDFAVRQVREVDPTARTLSVDPPIEVGATVQFLGEDASGADLDLREQLSGLRAGGALAFVTDERVDARFAEPGHDAELVSTIVDRQAVVGLLCSAVVTSFARPLLDDGPTAAVVLVEPRDSGA